MPIAPEQYAATSAYDLLVAAARGHVPFDHRLLHRLLDSPTETLPDIVRFSKEERPDDRVDLSVDLMRIFAAQPTQEAVPFLMAEFRRYPEEVPDEMTEVLARIGAGALEGLLELWEDGVAMEETAFHLATLGVRDQRVLDVIEEVRKDDKEEASYLQQIYDEYGGQTPERYDIYAEYPDTDIPDLDLLPGIEREQFLDSECAEHRRTALDHLIGQDLPAALVNRVLRIAQSDPETEVRGLAWEALRDTTDQEKIRDSMMARIDNPNTPALERASLCIGLAYNLDDETVRPHLDAAYNDPATRAKAVEAMARSFDRGFAPTMVKHLEDPDPDIAQAAMWGVGYLRVSSEAPKLEKMFEDPDRRTEALYCYALAAPAEDSKLGLKQLEQRMEKLANGLAEEEEELIHHAFDLRFELVGKRTSFSGGHSHGDAAPAQAKVGRNEPCPCGSGKKYKKCCGA